LAPRLLLYRPFATQFSPKEGKTMKSTFKKLTMTVAALAIATGVAGAQTFRADVPFAFQVGGKVMPAGEYRLQINKGYHTVTVANYDAKQTAMVMSNGATYLTHAEANTAPTLTFACGTGRCALARLSTGSAEPALTFPTPKLGPDEHATLTEIRLVKVNGD
jgi:hypothetical protein